jgi:hypothetical protein
MPRRRFAAMSVVQLEKLFDEKRNNPETLESILGELSHRTTPRSKELKRRVTQALSVGSYSAELKSVLTPASPEDLRFCAEYFLKGQPDWTLEERTEGATLARHFINLAKLVERRLSKVK